MSYLKITIYSTLIIILLGLLVFLAWAIQLNQQINKGLAEKSFLQPTSYYTSPLAIYPQELLSPNDLTQTLDKRAYRRRESGQNLFPGDYSVEENRITLAHKLTQDPLFQRNPHLSVQVLHFDEQGVSSIENQNGASSVALLEPVLFAQFLGNEPIMQRRLEIGEIPTLCLNAVLAIEDSNFLEHQGISVSGIGRAFLSNLLGGRFKQGGSTITQQMVKNYFLSSEKTIKRKLTEILMSVLLEFQSSKDQIFETYLNIIYLGQNGPFQIRGFGAASEYYFQKPIERLELSECALLAAVLNSPGMFDPFKKPEAVTQRRTRVLDRMKELTWISDTEYDLAQQSPLPRRSAPLIQETAPYYIDFANNIIHEELDIDPEGLQVYTGLSLSHQELAQKHVQQHLKNLEENQKTVKKNLEANKKLESVLLNVDHRSSYVTAIVGGRNYRRSQFNRSIKAKRQVGSIAKPFVYLTALDENQGKQYRPDSLLSDREVNYRYERQSWTPQNYTKRFYGDVSLAFALAQSLNASTVSLGMELGLDKVIQTSKSLGIESTIPQLPSILLGAYEATPWEVLKSYHHIAVAKFSNPLAVRSIVGQGNTWYFEEDLYEDVATAESDFASETPTAESMYELTSIMKLAFQIGTAQSAKAHGFNRPAAGKTGTTSDYKDSWFAGYTPDMTSIVWVGYDDNTTSDLTGASGALPIWSRFMNDISKNIPVQDFKWPEQLEQESINLETGAEPIEVQVYAR